MQLSRIRRGLAVFFALAIGADAGVIEITITGTLDDWTNIEAYPGLVVPVPFAATFRVDEAAADQDADPQHGLYLSNLPLDFTFGSYHEQHDGCVVEVYSGRDNLWGFFWRNVNEVEAFGVTRPALIGIYGFDVSVFDPSITPTDRLEWIVLSQDKSDTNDHFYAHGHDGAGNSVNGDADNNIQSYSAQVIPEPCAILLFALGAAACVGYCLRPSTNNRRPP